MAEKAFERMDKKIREKWQGNIEYRQRMMNISKKAVTKFSWRPSISCQE